MKLGMFVGSYIAVAASSVAAQTTIFTGAHGVTGELCVGIDCVASEVYGLEWIKIKAVNTRMLFQDTSSEAGSFPSADWMLVANDGIDFGQSYFALEDVDGNGQVVKFLQGAPANSLVMNSDGFVGLGTSMPARELHIVDGSLPTIRIEQDGSGGNTPGVWDIWVADGFRISSPTDAAAFYMHPSTESFTLVTHSNRVGIATGFTVPEASLMVGSNIAGAGAGDAKILVSETDSTQTARTLMELRNNGRPDIVMANSGTGKEWAFGAGSNFVLKTGAVGSTDAEKTLHLKLFGASGNMEITGQIITGGGTCGGGCDAVFAPGYELPTIEEHSQKMFALGYLPNVGPTIENQPINVSDKLGRMLNELEHAHIFIAQQQDVIAKMQARLDALEGKSTE